MRQAVESEPSTGEWPPISAEDMRELIPDPDRVAEEMIDEILRAQRLLGPAAAAPALKE